MVLALAAWSAAAVWFFYSRGWLLYYGDAEAHLNIARRIFDSQTPGYDQIGTAWLPLPHWLMLPFVAFRRVVAKRHCRRPSPRRRVLWRPARSCSRPCGGCSHPRPPPWPPRRFSR